jgi:hypothetical protein
MTGHEFTSEQLYQQAQGNLTAFIVGTMAYLKEQGRTPEEWVTFIGKRFAPGWESDKGRAKAAMQSVVLNLLSAGGSLHSLTGDDAQAEAVIADWPSADVLEFFGLSLEDVDPIHTIFTPIAASLNLRYEWHRAGNQVTFRFSR